MVLRPLSEKLQKMAEDELNEVPHKVQQNLQHIKDWIAIQPHLKSRLDDQWLVSFLRGCKYSLEKTKQKLDYYYTIHNIDDKIFQNRDPFSPEIQEFLSKGYFVPLPKCAQPTAPRTFLIHTPNYDTETMSPVQGIKAALMSLDMLLRTDDNFVIAGQQILLNVEDFDYKMLLQLTPNIVKILCDYLFNGYPSRIKAIFIINCPPIYETVLNLAKPLLSEKINKRIKFYKEDEVSEIYKFIPRTILPEEYGGIAGTVKGLAARWLHEIEGYAEWFKEDALYGVQESKRIVKQRSKPELIGVEGSFRTLMID